MQTHSTECIDWESGQAMLLGGITGLNIREMRSSSGKLSATDKSLKGLKQKEKKGNRVSSYIGGMTI